MTELKAALPSPSTEGSGAGNSDQRAGPRIVHQKTFSEGLEWRLADNLLHVMLTLSELYFLRGSAREAEYFADQAEQLAQTLRSPLMVCRALSQKTDMQLCLGQLEDAGNTLQAANTMAKEIRGSDSANIMRLKGDHLQQLLRNEQAEQSYVEAYAVIEELRSVYAVYDDGLSARYELKRTLCRLSSWLSRRKSGSLPFSKPEAGLTGVAPEILALVLAHHSKSTLVQ